MAPTSMSFPSRKADDHPPTPRPDGDPFPVGGAGVALTCAVCGRSHYGRGPLCFCCRTVADQLRLPLVPVVTQCEYRVGGRVHHRLRAYKDGSSAEVRAACRRVLAGGLTRWVARRGSAWFDYQGGLLVVTTVPSSRRTGEPPVAGLVAEVPGLAERHLPLLVRGRAEIGHLRAHREAFTTAPGVDRSGLAGLAVVVVDDTTTTGASVQSAAAALRLAGARVVGGLAIGRALPGCTPL